MKKTFCALFSFLLILASILSGCDKTKEAKEPKSNLSGEITLHVMWGGERVKERWENGIKQFESEHPNTKINLQFNTDVYYKQLQEFADSGRMPDVFQGDAAIFKDLNAKGQLKDIGMLAKVNGANANAYFERALLDYSTDQGKLVALPAFIVTPKLLYSKSFFQKWGLSEPTDDMTWEQFAELCRTIHDKTNGTNPYAVLFPLQVELLSALVLSNGGSFTPDGKAFHGYLDDTGSVDAIGWYMDLARKWLINTDFIEESAHLLATGAAAMFISYGVPDSKEREQIGVVPFPHFAAGTRAVNSIYRGMAVSETTQNPDLAWALLKYIVIDKNETTTEWANAGVWGASNPMNTWLKDDKFYNMNQQMYPYVKKDFFDWNVNVWNVSYAKIYLQLKQLALATDYRNELTDIAQLFEQTLQ
ncbi:ABC transporter substrate-binding protein [Paenibacillus cymbidii]|uniref:ABC transporter substrate-binding protein n=1 Tax=Paenibacillus cymbidii TaxID=1639034 RepID=UPI001080824B|nr:extracellular solute-binding protein [Paenibacillus cymbidii]